ncbi:MAG: acyl--CoA ligase [Planctomycetota bacterium]|nr:acyl--CoA ligase [Planctomycetota bacterium]
MAEKRSVDLLVKNGQETDFRFPAPDYGTFLEGLARAHPDKIAAVHLDVERDARREVTYAQLFDRARRLAALLRARGLKDGDRFCLGMGNRLETLEGYLAAQLGRLVAVPFDLEKDPIDRKLYKLKDSGARALIVADDYKERGRFEEEMAELTAALPANAPMFSVTAGLLGESFEEALAATPAPKDLPSAREDDPILVIYTSGTTGQPKGAVQTLKNVYANAAGIVDWQQMTPEDRFFMVLPIHHINSSVFSMTAISRGARVILCTRYSGSRFWKLAEREGATIGSIVATIMQDLLGQAERVKAEGTDLSSFKRILIGSAPVPPATARRFIETFGIPLIQGYGLTEVNLRVTGVPVDMPKAEYLRAIDENSAGVELTWANVNVWDDAGKELPEGALGELVIRGPVVMKGYLNQPETTADAVKEGWFRSGDLGCWKNIGGRRHFFIQGRKKELIIKGGVNISPLAIEDALLADFPELQSVYAIGVPDDRYGEEICAVLVFPESLPEAEWPAAVGRIAARVKQGHLRNLGKYESPVYFVAYADRALPKTSTGKVKRADLRDLLKANPGTWQKG